MMVPEWFEQALASQFGGRFLVRWSGARECYVIDEKIARGIAIPPARLAAKLAAKPEAEREDFQFRLRHGTEPFVEVFPGNQAKCPRCAAKVLLRSRQWYYAHCGACGKDFKAVHYDLGELLLEELRYLDFDRGGDERIQADMDAANAAKEAGDKKEAADGIKDAIWDDWRRITGVGRSTTPA